jgi:hypothetical protein
MFTEIFVSTIRLDPLHARQLARFWHGPAHPNIFDEKSPLMYWLSKVPPNNAMSFWHAPRACEAYARARQSGVEKWVDEMITISDAAIGQPQEVMTAVRNAVDVRKWLAGKLIPRQYGDTPSQFTVNTTNNVMVISEEKQRELQEIRRRLLSGEK